MTNDITLNTLSFKWQYGDKAGSLRREVSRGVNLPTELKIAHTDYVDSATKLPGKRSLARFDRYIELTPGNIAPVSAYIVVTRPNDANVTSADILAVIGHLVSLLSTNDTGLDLDDEIFVNGEQ